MSSATFRPDRLILKRQKDEAAHEHLVASNLYQYRMEQKADWENKTADNIRKIVQRKHAASLDAQLEEQITDRRKKLSKLLYDEKDMYEHELKEITRPDPEKGKREMARRALDLKKKREDERVSLVQDKLYQQWRESIDELRTQDAKLFELQVTYERGVQCDDKEEREKGERRENAIYDALWQEGYHSKIERELREKEMRSGLQKQMANTLSEQIRLKQELEDEEKEVFEKEKAEMRVHWSNAEREAAELVERQAAVSREERTKVDAYKKIVEEQQKKQEEEEKLMDKQFVLSVLKKEKELAEKEEADKLYQKKKVLEFNEKLKMDMNRKAESDALLVQMQNEEQERQWQKRFAQWEKEELARRALLEDVYSGRMEQIELKNEVRSKQKAAIVDERERVENEIRRLEGIDRERAHADATLKKRHQEELFRQMDFHQVQRHRELQQHMIEQRQAAIAEERFKQAKDSEQEKQAIVQKRIQDHQAEKRRAAEAAKATSAVVAPWDRD